MTTIQRFWIHSTLCGLVVATLLISPATAQSAARVGWPFELTIDPFHIHSDSELPGRESLEAILNPLQSDVSEIFRLPAQPSPIHVVLFGDPVEYQKYMQHYFPTVVSRRAIFLQDRGPGMLFTYWHDDVATDLRHEATHALLNRSGNQLPLWLDEGLAKYFELPRQLRTTGSDYLPEIIDRAERGLVPSLEQLESIDQMLDFTESDYRDSWAWIHFMLHRRHETKQTLIDYVAKIQQKLPQAPMHRRLADISPEPMSEFRAHFLTLRDSTHFTQRRPLGQAESIPE
jgi:hypothetical protein